jgi:hypothetical protein
MIDPADVPTINAILTAYGVDNLLDPAEYALMLQELQDRETIMINDLGPRIWAKNLDRIIKQK